MAEAIAEMPGPAPGLSQTEGWWDRQAVLSRTFYWGIHLSCLSVFWVGASPEALLLLACTFYARMFGITGGYHRYFSHKTYKTSRVFQFVLAFLGASSVQKGSLWWASHHRIHHKYADVPGADVHSPKDGFWYCHQGWIFDGKWHATVLDQIQDFARYPELVWLNRWHVVAPLSLAVLCYAIGGGMGLLWGFSISTVALWHSTYAINSLAHLFGTRRYDTPDTSRNNLWLALLTMGEGWHNNHHRYCAASRQGFRWWEIDLTYYILRGLALLGIIWDMREPPAHVVNAEG